MGLKPSYTWSYKPYKWPYKWVARGYNPTYNWFLGPPRMNISPSWKIGLEFLPSLPRKNCCSEMSLRISEECARDPFAKTRRLAELVGESGHLVQGVMTNFPYSWICCAI